MFPVLTTDSLLSTLGLGTLSDAISCEVEEERNGSYELTLEYPQGGAHADDIALNALIVAKPNFTDNPQPFRIYSITKEISGKIEVHAQHISYDLGGVIVSPTTMTGATCKQAGEYLLAGTPFTFKTDKTNSANFKVDVPSSARSWFGGKSGSLMGVYGTGEYHYDGYDVEFNLHRGTNRGVELRYGKNLTELKSEADCSNLASSVVCFYEENGAVTSGTAVSTGLVGITRELAIDVSDDYNTAPSSATLTARATQYIADHNLTVPKTNITLDFVQASKLKDRVDLCDTVSIYYEALGVSASAKCIRTVWDVLAERYTETEFGDAKTNIADTIVEVEQVAAETVTKTIMQQAIDSATEQITGNNGGYIVLHDANNDGFPDELLIMDTADISTATNIWRFNSSGLGYSSMGYSGTYGLAITQNGAIVADFITSGTLNANVIRAGILQDALGKNSWNLATGALSITEGTIDIVTNSSTFDSIRLRYIDANQNVNTESQLMPYGLYAKDYAQQQMVSVGGVNVSVLRQGTTPGTWYSTAGLTNGGLVLGSSPASVQGGVAQNGFIRLYDANGLQRTYIEQGSLWQYDASGNKRTYLEYGDIFLYTSAEKTTAHLSASSFVTGGSLRLYDPSENERTRLSVDGLSFYNAGGTQTGNYPAAGLRLAELNDAYSQALTTSGTSHTFELASGMYLLASSRYNNASTAQDGLWLVSVFPTGTSHIMPILTPSGNTTASITNQYLLVTAGSNNVRFGVFRVN